MADNKEKPDPKFDPYHKWLGIPKGKRPPNYYILLGISPKESDIEVIETAIERQRSYISQHLNAEHHKWAARIIYEIDEAQVYLSDPYLRKEYDEKLKKLRQKQKRNRPKRSSAVIIPGETAFTSSEADDFVPTYFKIVAILTGAFMIMAVFSFMLPWQEVVFGPPEIDKQDDPVGLNAPAAPSPLRTRKSLGNPKKRVVEIKNKSIPKEITNSIGMKLVLIPSGEFMMGLNHPKARTFEKPMHRVHITKPFYMGVYEVTQNEFEKVMGVNPSKFQTDSRLPVEQVSWDQIQEFLKKLSNFPEEKAGRTYRLPTEAEWEYACRAGTTTYYHYGDIISSNQANFNGEHPGENPKKGPYLRTTVKVGSYKPNSFGLYDMHGNVNEIVSDWGGEDYYSKSPLEDPQGPSFGTKGIARGGGWDSWIPAPASGVRVSGPRSTVLSQIGFRVVCETSRAKGNSVKGKTTVKTKKETLNQDVLQNKTFLGHDTYVSSVAFSSNGELIASGSHDKTIRLWNVQNGNEVWKNTDATTRILKVAFSTNGRQLLACDENRLHVIDIKSGKTVDTFYFGPSERVDFSRDRKLMLKVYKQRELTIFNLNTKKIHSTKKRHNGSSIGIFDPQGRHVVYGEYGLDRENLITGKKQKRIIEQWGYFEALDISPDGRVLATASGVVWNGKDEKSTVGNCLIRLCDLNNGREIAKLKDHNDWLWSVTFSPDGNRILSGGGGNPDDWHGWRSGADTAIRLWDSKSHKLIKKFDGHRSAVVSLAFSPDGKHAISGSADKTIRLWKLPDTPSTKPIKKSIAPKRKKSIVDQKNIKTANWVLNKGGKLKIKYDVFERDISSKYQIPESPFQIMSISLLDLRNIRDNDLVNIKNATEITELILMGTGISNNGLRHLVGFKKLSSLNLAVTNVSGNGLRSLSGMTSLEKLFFGGCPIRGEGLVHLKGLYNLKLLGLIDTQLTDTGMPHIATMKSLTELRLRDTKVSNTGVKRLVGLTNLRKLDLVNTRISQTTVKQLKRALPYCEIKK